MSQFGAANLESWITAPLLLVHLTLGAFEKVMKAPAFLSALAAVITLPAFADCVAPTAPGTPPSGEKATREEMVAAQAAIKGYDAAVASYSECIKKSGGSASDAEDAVRSVERLAAKFNAELKAFKQKNGG